MQEFLLTSIPLEIVYEQAAYSFESQCSLFKSVFVSVGQTWQLLGGCCISEFSLRRDRLKR